MTLTLSTEYFLDIFLLKEPREDCERANGELCWGVVGSNILTTDNKVCTLGHQVTWYALRSLGPASELTVSVKPETVR